MSLFTSRMNAVITAGLVSCSWAIEAGAVDQSEQASTYVRTTSACPSAQTTWRELQGLVSEEELTRARSQWDPPWALVEDRGDAYEVRVGGEHRSYTGPDRDCGHRAKIAAVFIALRMDAARLASSAERVPKRDQEPEPQRRAEAEPRNREPAPRGETQGELEQEPESQQEPEPARALASAVAFDASLPPRAWRSIGGSIDTTIPLDRADTHRANLGIVLTGMAGRGIAGGALSAGATLPTSLQFPSTSVSAVRIPIELTFALRPTTGPWQLMGEAGLAVDLWRFRGRAPESDGQWRAMLGGIAKISACYFGWGRVGPSISLFVRGFPKEHRFVIAPLGDVGGSNQLWMGVRVGAAWDYPVTAAAR